MAYAYEPWPFRKSRYERQNPDTASPMGSAVAVYI